MSEHQHGDHQHGASAGPDFDQSPVVFWEELYRSKPGRALGTPSAVLVEVASTLPPGTALDLGCAEGGDALWLAARGWRVTAVDISTIALERGEAHAVEHGLTERIDWQQHDLVQTAPEGTFDLVSAQFLQSPVAFEREAVLRRAAAAVAPGGRLLVVGHASFPSWAWSEVRSQHLPSAEEVWESLELSAPEWTVEELGSRERSTAGPDGELAPHLDSVVLARRALNSSP